MAAYALNDTRYLRPLAELLRSRLDENRAATLAAGSLPSSYLGMFTDTTGAIPKPFGA